MWLHAVHLPSNFANLLAFLVTNFYTFQMSGKVWEVGLREGRGEDSYVNKRCSLVLQTFGLFVMIDLLTIFLYSCAQYNESGID